MGKQDISFKTIAERDPLSTLRIFGHAPLPPDARVTPVEREVVTPIKSVDHAFLIESGAERWIEHLEAETSLSGDDLLQIGRRANLLAMSHRVPVWTTIVLMSRRRVPSALPEQIEERYGGVMNVCWPRYMKLWEQDAGVVLAQGAEGVLPLVGGMNASAEQWEEALARIARVREREQEKQLYTELSVWCSINYNEDRIREVARRMTAEMKELVLQSFREMFREELQQDREQVLREGLQEGLQEGRQEGRQEGALEAARQDLEFVVTNRFPGLVASERIAGLGNVGQVNELFRALVLAQDRAAAEAVVQRVLPAA